MAIRCVCRFPNLISDHMYLFRKVYYQQYNKQYYMYHYIRYFYTVHNGSAKAANSERTNGVAQ